MSLERYGEVIAVDYVLKRLVSNLRCNRCNSPVLLSELEDYLYQCLVCDEGMFSLGQSVI